MPSFALHLGPALCMLAATAAGATSEVAIERAYPKLSFSDPVFVTAIPGTDRLAVIEQAGVVRSFVDSDAATSSSVLLDIRSRVIAGGEKGLLGLAFDPAYATNGYLYVNYTAPSPLRTRITRFKATRGVADPASEVLLLELAQPYPNHNGGMLAFGRDGMLYAAVGDGGSGNDPQGHGQDLGSLLGKILRLKPTPGALIPADNPFVGTPGARGEVWAWGLRNPWRFSVDRLTGELWIADVGQNAIEEIDLGARGANYGWRVYEGSRSNLNPDDLPASRFTAPVFEYDHDEGQSITGGYRYRGRAVRALAGRYVYGDFVSGRIWALQLDGNAAAGNAQIGMVANPSSFGETASGELLIVSYGGTLHRIVPKH